MKKKMRQNRQSCLQGAALLPLTLLFLLLVVNVAFASTDRLSGKVADSFGAPLAAALVEVFPPGAATPLTGTVTNDQGEYVLTIESGVYDLRVTPPAGSGFQVATLEQQVIASDTVIDFRLIPVNTVALRGRVLDGFGQGVADQQVQLAPAGSNNWQSVTSEATGNYAFAVAPGDYQLAMYGRLIPNTPGDYAIGSVDLLSLTADKVFDLHLPVKQVTVHVQDNTGAPVAGAMLSTNQLFGLPLQD